MPMRHYPVYLNLQGRECLVVGGGSIAERKVAALIAARASVTVVSLTATARLKRWAAAGRIRHERRAFADADVRGKWLIFAATDALPVNTAVFSAAVRRRIFANVVDQPALCSFIAPSILRKGDVTVAVSTGGRSPALARKLRMDLARAVGPEYARMLRLIQSVRPLAQRRLTTYRERKRFFDVLLDGPVFGLVRSGRLREAGVAARRLLEAHARPDGARRGTR